MSKINCDSKRTIAQTSVTNEERKKKKNVIRTFVNVEIMFRLRFLKGLRRGCMRVREIVKKKYFPDSGPFLPPAQSSY